VNLSVLKNAANHPLSVQTIVSVAFPAALLAFVTPTNTAATWSVLARALHASPWPTLLQTDSAARRGVRRRVSNGLLFQTITVLLISAASVVTPLGLYQVVEPAHGTKEIQFAYVQDASAFGYGSASARLVAPFTRACGTEVCPGSWVNRTCVQQGLVQNCTGVVYGRDIPRVWYDAFREGAEAIGESVASIFDIQWRTQMNASDAFGEYGWYVKSGYRQVGVVALEKDIHLVDGLVVDAREGRNGGGGIGFRNHTAPAQAFEYGSTWTEDILFVEPDVQCVNLNVTLEFVLSQNNTSRLSPRELALVDHGGFSKLAREKPDLTYDAVKGNGQDGINLRERAWKAAWAANYLTLAFFNATDFDDEDTIKRLDVTEGMRFTNNGSTSGAENFGSLDLSAFSVEYLAIRTTMDYGEYLALPATPPRNKSSSNPFGISKAHFNLISDICAGANTTTPAYLDAALVGCGVIYGAARRIDTDVPNAELSPQPGSRWSIPIYSCAASMRASVRTVTFSHNATSNAPGTELSSLRAIAAVPKTYSTNNPNSWPLWAVEDMRPLKINLTSAQPLWGLITPSSSLIRNPPKNITVTTHRSPSLQLPGLLTSTLTPLLQGTDYSPTSQGQNLPGVDFYTQALQAAFTIRRPGSVGYEGYADYSGATSLATYRLWRELSASEEGAAELVRRVWTDVAANSVVGTRGWGLEDAKSVSSSAAGLKKREEGSANNNSGGTDDGVTVPVTVWRRRVRYHLLFMIPAIVVLVLAFLVVGVWVVQAIRGRGRIAYLRRMIEATSAGRLMGTMLWPGKTSEVCMKRGGTNDWINKVGKGVVLVDHGHEGLFIMTTSEDSEPNGNHANGQNGGNAQEESRRE
jgi:hypothetical protein